MSAALPAAWRSRADRGGPYGSPMHASAPAHGRAEEFRRCRRDPCALQLAAASSSQRPAWMPPRLETKHCNHSGAFDAAPQHKCEVTTGVLTSSTLSKPVQRLHLLTVSATSAMLLKLHRKSRRETRAQPPGGGH